MPFFDEERYKNGPETEGDIMVILRSIQSLFKRHKSGPGTRFHQPYYPIYHS
mgnify:CR=1 FL=1